MMIRFRMLKATVFTCLLSLIALASASAQLAPTRKAPRNEPLEKYDNPPAPPRKIETSPRMISQFGTFTSFQVNVDANGNNILGDAANECSISVDPTNRQQDDNRLETVQQRYLQLPAGRLGIHNRRRHALDVPRCSAERSLSQRPGDKLR